MKTDNETLGNPNDLKVENAELRKENERLMEQLRLCNIDQVQTESELTATRKLLDEIAAACTKIRDFGNGFGGTITHHPYCNFPFELNDFCNCGITDMKRALTRYNELTKKP